MGRQAAPIARAAAAGVPCLAVVLAALVLLAAGPAAGGEAGASEQPPPATELSAGAESLTVSSPSGPAPLSDASRRAVRRREVAWAAAFPAAVFLLALAWMRRRPEAVPHDRRHRRRMLGLLLAAFVLRGAAIQCITPPLEGPDEYQHLAYIQYLLEEHRLPILGQALVPKSMYPFLRDQPHCDCDWQQTGPIGSRRYDQFFDSPAAAAGSFDIQMYQAQHPPLYYLAMAPVHGLAARHFGMLGSIYLLRLINVVLGGVALMLLTAPLERLVRDRGLYDLAALAVFALPIFLVNAGRVANDALALALGGLGLFLLVRLPEAARGPRLALASGAALALGTMTKLLVFPLLPAALAYLSYLAWRSPGARRRWLVRAGQLALGYLALSLPYHAWALVTYGTPLPTQESILGEAAGPGLTGMIGLVRIEHLKTFFFDNLVLGNLWLSGWSFHPPDSVFPRIFAIILAVALTGAVPLLRRRLVERPSAEANPDAPLALCILVVVFAFLAAYLKGLNKLLEYGFFGAPSYYVMVAFPALLQIVAAAAQGYGRRLAAALLAVLAFTFLFTEIVSLVGVAVPHWADTPDWATAMRRLATIHPVFPAPRFFAGLYTAASVLNLIAAAGALAARPAPSYGSIRTLSRP